jgi:hypothetical protein
MRGEVMGINSSVGALAQAIPAILAGYLSAYNAVLPVLVGSIATLIGGILFVIMFK